MPERLDRLFAQSSQIVEMAKLGDNYALQQVVEVLGSPDDKERCLLAFNKLALKELLTDTSDRVRGAVAAMGFGHEVLYQDPNEKVRATVADRGSFLDVLLHDESPMVREAVAEQNYGLEVLCNDPDENVRSIAQRRMQRKMA